MSSLLYDGSDSGGAAFVSTSEQEQSIQPIQTPSKQVLQNSMRVDGFHAGNNDPSAYARPVVERGPHAPADFRLSPDISVHMPPAQE